MLKSKDGKKKNEVTGPRERGCAVIWGLDESLLFLLY